FIRGGNHNGHVILLGNDSTHWQTTVLPNGTLLISHLDEELHSGLQVQCIAVVKLPSTTNCSCSSSCSSSPKEGKYFIIGRSNTATIGFDLWAQHIVKFQGPEGIVKMGTPFVYLT